jgi:hypothetical protein
MAEMTSTAHRLAAMSKDELVSLAVRAKGHALRAAEALKKPARQGTHTIFGWAGGATSGVIRAFVPTIFGMSTDGWLGLLISGFSLLGAGDIWVDSIATFGVGMTSPAISRTTEGALRSWFAQSKKPAVAA